MIVWTGVGCLSTIRKNWEGEFPLLATASPYLRDLYRKPPPEVFEQVALDARRHETYSLLNMWYLTHALVAPEMESIETLYPNDRLVPHGELAHARPDRATTYRDRQASTNEAVELCRRHMRQAEATIE